MLAIVREGRARGRTSAPPPQHTLAPMAQRGVAVTGSRGGARRAASPPALGGGGGGGSVKPPLASSSSMSRIFPAPPTPLRDARALPASITTASAAAFAPEASMFASFVVDAPGPSRNERGRPLTAGSSRPRSGRPPSASPGPAGGGGRPPSASPSRRTERPTTATSVSTSPTTSAARVRPRSAQLAARAAEEAALRGRVGGDAGSATTLLARSSADISAISDTPGHGVALPPWMPVDIGVVPPSILPESVYRVRRERAVPAGEDQTEWTRDASGWYTKVEFPSERPTRRREAIALTEAYVTLLSQAPSAGATPRALAAAALRIHHVCAHEIVRQVSIHCAERGALLRLVWQRYAELVRLIQEMAERAASVKAAETAALLAQADAAAAENLRLATTALRAQLRAAKAEAARAEAAERDAVATAKSASARAAAAEGALRQSEAAATDAIARLTAAHAAASEQHEAADEAAAASHKALEARLEAAGEWCCCCNRCARPPRGAVCGR